MAEQQLSSPAEHRSSRWRILFVTLGFLLIWELLYSLGLINPKLLSHPIAILKTFGDPKFLTGFSGILIIFALGLMLGGVAGVTLGTSIVRNAWLSSVTLRFLRMGLWIPFLVSGALPIWPIEKGREFLAFSLLLAVSITAVAFSACYHYLTARFLLGLSWRETRPRLIRAATLQALFIALVSQAWTSRWDWFLVLGTRDVAVGYATLMLIVCFMLLLDRLFQSSFDQTAATRKAILEREVATKSWSSLWGAGLFILLCLVFWQLFSVSGLYWLFSSPLDVVKALYPLLITGTNIPHMDPTLWHSIGVSLTEIAIGLILGGVAALLVASGLSTNNPAFKKWALSFLPLTYITPLVIPLLLVSWIGPLFFWQTTIGVAFLSFFPFVQGLWGLRSRAGPFRLLLSADEALPFAFIAMLFGETMYAVSGLGFSISVVRHVTHEVTEGLATSLIVVALLVLLSSTLRWVAKRAGPSMKNDVKG